MKKNEEKVLERNLEQKHFKDAAKAIKGGKESGSLTNVELVENLVETVEKTVIKPVLHSFHRVFNRWKTLRASTLCINRAGSTKRRNGLHF